MDITRPLNIRVVGLSLGSFLSITFILCVVYDLIFPGSQMYQSWIRLLPGFEWLTLKSFFLGIIERFLYGIYIALIFVPLYNLFYGVIVKNG
ncbi:MAG: hypothetical protein HZB79_04395 [Deltaproteobacteria bacterium]|nr:hypothetical protein [Deltaproteobacteria bacterium]